MELDAIRCCKYVILVRMDYISDKKKGSMYLDKYPRDLDLSKALHSISIVIDYT